VGKCGDAGGWGLWVCVGKCCDAGGWGLSAFVKESWFSCSTFKASVISCSVKELACVS